MGKIIHCCLSVRGYLTESDKMLSALFTREDGSRLSARDAKEYLMDCLAEGKEVLPFGKPCEGFDYKTGCPGQNQPPEKEG